MSVTLEDLRNEWSDHSRRLDERLRAAEHLLREGWIERQRERVRKAAQLGAFGIIVWIATMVLLSMFLARHFTQSALFVSAFALDAWVVATGVAGVLQQRAIDRLDYGRPLVELQAQVEALRIARIRTFNRAFLTGQVVWWIPFFAVVFAAATGVDLYAYPQFVAFALWNLAGGLAFIPLAMWLARRYGHRLAGHSAIRHVADSIAGRDIAAAREYLGKLRQFEGGTGPAR